MDIKPAPRPFSGSEELIEMIPEITATQLKASNPKRRMPGTGSVTWQKISRMTKKIAIALSV